MPETKNDRPYMCKHFKWTSWRHYGVEMPEGACEFCGYEMGSCKATCKDFDKKEEYQNGRLEERV